MANAACSIGRTCDYNMTNNTTSSPSGWINWQTATGGYASSTKCTVFEFTTPNGLSGTAGYNISSLSVRVKHRKSGSGTFYFKVLTSDPRSGGKTDFTSHHGSGSWSGSSSWKDDYYTVSVSLAQNTLYYFAIGGSGSLAEISRDLSLSVNYISIDKGTDPSLYITDNGNNTATISGYLGSNGSNNGITGSTLYWTTNGMQPSGGSWYTPSESMGATSGGAYSKTIDIPDGCSGIWAVIYCDFKHNRTNTQHIYGSVRYYKAPGDPGKPTISYTKSRLTIKEPWTFSWSAASAGNSNSPINGYSFRLYKNGVIIPGLVVGTDNYITKNSLATHTYVDRESTSRTVVIDPTDFGFLPGDTVKLGIWAYSKNGKNTLLYNADEVISDTYTVQNAGIVQVRTASGWHEGQVHVRTASGWHEAETVQVRTASGWKESE
jgi:hypothetical protein